jgi:hypothetical protein
VCSGNNSGIRGHRVGAGEPGEPSRLITLSEPRIDVSFWCARYDETIVTFAASAKIPDAWPCTRCGQLAGRNKGDPPPSEPFRTLKQPLLKTHREHVHERRSPAQAAETLQWAIERCRALRDLTREA